MAQSMLLQQETSSGSNVISHALGEIQYMAWFLLTPFIAGDCLVVFVCLRQENWALFKARAARRNSRASSPH
jgi:hypothetical protein